MEKYFSLKVLVVSLIAIFALGSLGLIAYHIFAPSTPERITLNLPKDLSQAFNSFNLQINNPDDELLVFNRSLLVSGTTSPNAAIIVTDNDNDSGFSTDSEGNFSQVITLEGGLNLLTIDAFDSSGNTKQVKRTVYYSQEQLP